MFTIKAYKPKVTHHYTAECFAENNIDARNIVVDAPGQPGIKAKQYMLPLEGDQAYDKIEVRNMQGMLIETFIKATEPPPVNRKARRKTTAKKRPTKK